MNEPGIPAKRAQSVKRENPLTRSWAGMLGLGVLAAIVCACVLTLPWTLGRVQGQGGASVAGSPRYDVQYRTARHLPPSWWGVDVKERDGDAAALRLQATARAMALESIARERGVSVERLVVEKIEPTAEQLSRAMPHYLMGTDLLGRDLLVRCLAGGGISLGIGIAAALLSVILGTVYGSIAGYVGGRVDGVMMRIVDVLYGLPYVLLVVLLAVAASSVMEEHVSRQGARTAWMRGDAAQQYLRGEAKSGAPDIIAGIVRPATSVQEILENEAARLYPARVVSDAGRTAFELGVLLVAIGGVSWLTMARVVRGQVLSLKNQPFVEAARAMGVPVSGIFLRHLLPNLVGPIIVYATLTVPQAVLQESFLSFLGIGVRAPMPSWGNLAAEGLGELNPIKSHWWVLLFPCLMLGVTLLALNFVGEGLREALDPKRARR